jgi:hypothetical protein
VPNNGNQQLAGKSNKALLCSKKDNRKRGGGNNSRSAENYGDHIHAKGFSYARPVCHSIRLPCNTFT